MSIWLTRAKAQSEAMASEIRQPTIIAPVQHIIHHDVTIEGAFDAIITTSQHACVGIKQYHNLPLYTVGETSAEAARKTGFSKAFALAHDALSLAAAIVSMHAKPMRLLYLAGAETRIDLAKLLDSQGHDVTTVVTYEAAQETSLPAELIQNWNTLTGVVFMSVGAVKAAHALIIKHRLDVNQCKQMRAYCISAPVAAQAGGLPWAVIHISESPTQQSLIEALNATISA